MPGHIEALRESAKKDPKRIVLPESNDPRILKAAALIGSLGIANIVLIGDENDINRLAKENSVSLGKTEIINPKNYAKRRELVDTFYTLRSHKGITPDEAEKTIIENGVFFAALMVRLGFADGFVAGAKYTSSDVARAALYCLGLNRDIGIMSSCFVIELKHCSYGDDGLFIFGDCGVVPNPNANKLAGIAISSSLLYEELFKRKAHVALLSYSTKGSAGGESVEKVLKALEIIKQKAPDLIIDGELQFDAAIVPEVAKIKAPESNVAGKANVLVFPNLDAGNISYKVTQRLGNARVVGPLFQGIKKPCSDLSRGCGIEEIIDAVAVTAVRAQK
ncbi:MAG: phosphate acetyltransferase [Candidatus Omnitrophota bacterium]